MTADELQRIKTQMLATLTCAKCGYEWLPRTWLVKMCPSCKTRKWSDNNGPKSSKKLHRARVKSATKGKSR